MEQNDVAVNPEMVVKKKSNATWICGLIGFITSIPNTLCAFLCAATVAGVEGALAGVDEEGNFNEAAADAAVESAAEDASTWLLAIMGVSVLCFILSFMGKGKSSAATGFLMILGSIFILVTGFIGYGSMLWGTATAGLYLASGIVAMVNAKRPA